jgi:hypothetical protein
METLCFGTYVRTLQAALQPPNGDKEVVDLLVGYIIDTANLLNKNGDPIYLRPGKVSLYLRCREDIPENICAATSSDKVIREAAGFFEENVVPFLVPHLQDDLIYKMKTLITDDDSVAPEKQASLLAAANAGNIALFLADTFLYAINKPNVHPSESPRADELDTLSIALQDAQQIEAMLAKIPKPEGIEVPEEPEDYELVYVDALIAAYNNAEGGNEITRASLPKHQKYDLDFKRRRKDYYSAETIRRATRDAFERSDTDQFDVLKEETYEGIIDIHSDNHPNGYVRLNKVMAQAASLPLTKCVLSRLPEWIGGSEKKGVCHILVNDHDLEGWVSNDE